MTKQSEAERRSKAAKKAAATRKANQEARETVRVASGSVVRVYPPLSRGDAGGFSGEPVQEVTADKHGKAEVEPVYGWISYVPMGSRLGEADRTSVMISGPIGHLPTG